MALSSDSKSGIGDRIHGRCTRSLTSKMKYGVEDCDPFPREEYYTCLCVWIPSKRKRSRSVESIGGCTIKVLGDGLGGICCGLALKKTIRRFDGQLDTMEDCEVSFREVDDLTLKESLGFSRKWSIFLCARYGSSHRTINRPTIVSTTDVLLCPRHGMIFSSALCILCLPALCCDACYHDSILVHAVSDTARRSMAQELQQIRRLRSSLL